MTIKISKTELEQLIYDNICQMLDEVKYPNDEDADVCTELIMKTIEVHEEKNRNLRPGIPGINV